MSARDWKASPPETLEDAFLLAEELGNRACDTAMAVFVERPHVERRASSVVIVWPDGMVTNEIAVHLRATDTPPAEGDK